MRFTGRYELHVWKNDTPPAKDAAKRTTIRAPVLASTLHLTALDSTCIAMGVAASLAVSVCTRMLASTMHLVALDSTHIWMSVAASLAVSFCARMLALAMYCEGLSEAWCETR
jgi:hypothetical protein